MIISLLVMSKELLSDQSGRTRINPCCCDIDVTLEDRIKKVC